jgi:hypothetical protein
MRAKEFITENPSLKDYANIWQAFKKDSASQGKPPGLVQRLAGLLMIPGDVLAMVVRAIRNPGQMMYQDPASLTYSQRCAELLKVAEQFPLTSLAIRQAYKISDAEWDMIVKYGSRPQAKDPNPESGSDFEPFPDGEYATSIPKPVTE